MFRWQKHSITKALPIAGLCLSFVAGLGISWLGPHKAGSSGGYRAPAGKLITDQTPLDLVNKAEWSIPPLDFELSNPPHGRSYFDSVFSQLSGSTRAYNIPYPFQKVLDRVNQYMGYTGQTDTDNAVKRLLFPLGRSLQRDAALGDDKNSKDMNLFFRYPRVVVGVDRTPKETSNPLTLNLQGRLFMGFHERSKVIEVISYNDLDGRYEYQIVHNYDAGKTPTVVYANRQVCLGCHQNRTPIFSNGPWDETNAHLPIYSVIEKQMMAAFGDVACDGSHTQPYCYLGTGTGKKYQYFGAPTQVDINAPMAIDTLVNKANYFPAFQKMWMNLCQTDDCQKKSTRLILTYLLNGQEGMFLSAQDKTSYLLDFEKRFQQRFPAGLKLPNPKIPNRDPLQDGKKTQAEVEASMSHIDGVIHSSLQELISNSAVSGKFEPLMVRGPLELMDGTEIDSEKQTNNMLRGFSEFFSNQDARVIDGWLSKQVAAGKAPSIGLTGDCQVSQSAASGGMDVQVACEMKDKSGLALETGYFPIRNNQVQGGLIENLFLFGASSNCDWQASQSTDNRVSGVACPALLEAKAMGSLAGDVLSLQFYKSETGLNARLIDGRLASQAQLNLKTGKLQVTIYDDVSLLDKGFMTSTDTPFNRTAVMKNVAKGLGIALADPDAGMDTLKKEIESDVFSADQVLATYKNPVNAFTHSCGMCHHNDAGVPPAFLGEGDEPMDLMAKCQRIEMCVPRMLYRLKMRNCPTDQIAKFQKTPMPAPNFFGATKIDSAVWQKSVAPQLIQFAVKLFRSDEVVNFMVGQGVDKTVAQSTVKELTQSDCPNVDYKLYENLPRCDFSKLKPNSQCGSFMSAFGNN